MGGDKLFPTFREVTAKTKGWATRTNPMCAW